LQMHKSESSWLEIAQWIAFLGFAILGRIPSIMLQRQH
jgi:hypothetical protein